MPYQDLLDQCLLQDFHRLRRPVQQAIRNGQALSDSLQQQLQTSAEKLARRRAAWPQIDYPDLPVSEHRDKILATLRQHQVVVVAGETGSGKTTQLPKLCLELGLGARGLIGHTQPRRLAARSVAQRLAEELRVPLGEQVGYQVRFQDQQSETTLVKLMTDGILLAETQKDPFLNRYEAIIIDEAHERSLNIDFLLGYLKRILPKRPDLKVVITSATIDLERFSRHFDDCPVIEVSGRSYPVEQLYRPLLTDDPDTADLTLQQGLLQALEEVAQLEREKGWLHGPRDVLVFLPGEREIREVAHEIRRAQGGGRFRDTEVLPLYARLPASEQQRVFQSHTGRRVVLATNVAETSLTVPGIRYVIDPGLARISRYSVRAGVQRLPVEPVSQASARQRAGRCGRIAEGLCIRLYAEDDFNSRPDFTEPEIRRTNLAAVILQMLALRLGDIADFPFVEPPDSRSIKDGFRLLFELGAVNRRNELTPLGRKLARLPVDPRLGRMLLEASARGCLQEVMIITAALNLQDPRERPVEHQQAADQAHAQWADPDSDFVALVNLWHHYETQRQELSASQLRKYCQKHFLSWMRMREWRDTHHQLKLLCREIGLTENTQPAGPQPLHQALLSGLLSNIGMQQENREFLGARNRKFFVHPGSKLARKPPKWVMAAELVETTRLYARMVARIQPEWVEPLAGHLLKRDYSSPHWEKKAARVAAFEKVTLFGLPVVTGRKVDYSSIDPVLSRELFIRAALVEGDYATKAPFMAHNQALLNEVQTLEDKARKRDILVDDQVLYEFYDSRIPAEVCRGASFEQWRKQAELQQPDLLLLTREELLARTADEVTQEAFPDHLQWQGISWQLTYNFAPGEVDDGVSMAVPAAMLAQLPDARLEWLVPGLLKEKCLALMRGLPKQVRKNFVPLPDYVDAAINALVPDDLPLGKALGLFFYKTSGVRIDDTLWQDVELPPHLQMNFRVLDEKGRLLGQGRDLEQLRQQYAGQIQAATRALDAGQLQVTGATGWSFGELPAVLEQQQAGVKIQAFPALVDEGSSIGVTLFDTAEKARQASERGLVRLIRLSLPQKDKYLQSQLPGLSQVQLMFSKIGSRQQLLDDLLDATARDAFLDADAATWPRDEEAFQQLLEQRQAQWVPLATERLKQVRAALELQVPLAARLKGKLDLALALTYQDVRRQLERLFYPGFIWRAGDWLKEYPRYLKAIDIRLEKAPRDRLRDQRQAEELEVLWQRWEGRWKVLQDKAAITPAFNEFPWLIEEYRVSLYAQQLGTRQVVSARRLEEAWSKLVS
ncbi:ATP-dependent RNA helicase HrpA [Marinospirillum alkaliphilum]|uniref:ATP-dependent helicase HrpA n=1 Tax=Marinospirillum alkaliphilum DSM 21637 TaxID=1122209 RepID=A0A1K1TZT5_9GAMM|nr:ATP-dependent RNA helicase HrpA [Marinospirillum alkaliphilum]SFX05717.1 ATP-dependent helicase HrpA [Marinospirillum alkaliphilum DSM 21637]